MIDLLKVYLTLKIIFFFDSSNSEREKYFKKIELFPQNLIEEPFNLLV